MSEIGAIYEWCESRGEFELRSVSAVIQVCNLNRAVGHQGLAVNGFDQGVEHALRELVEVTFLDALPISVLREPLPPSSSWKVAW